MNAPWKDWLTDSLFRIRVAPAAAEKLRELDSGVEEQLRQMLTDIAALADLAPPSMRSGFRAGDGSSLLSLHLGRITVRYAIDEQSRTLSVEHLILPGDDLVQAG